MLAQGVNFKRKRLEAHVLLQRAIPHPPLHGNPYIHATKILASTGSRRIDCG